MPPIPIYTQSPINATKASGVTPQTETAAEAQGSSDEKPTLTSGSGANAYPSAQPGAAPSLPVPTGTSQPQYVPVQPTPTRSLDYSGPPAPQPGAIPVAPGATSALPPPPRAGEAAQHAAIQTAAPHVVPMPYPAQMNIPAPTVPAAQRGTSTAFVSQVSRPVDLGSAPPQHFEHPPGYQQDVYATEFTSSQRAAAEAAAAEAEANALRRGANEGFDGDGQGVWGMTKKFVHAAGGKLQEAENEVWRRINKE